MEDFGLYLVMTDPVAGYERCCEAAVRAGVRMVQLRMKHTPREKILSIARACMAITAGSPTNFIVNDDPSVAAEAGADGVHVGQDDMPVPEVRGRYPTLKIVGLSTHNPEQAQAAFKLMPDYIGVGPVFPTPTKEVADPTVGVETAGRLCSSFPRLPAVAIGGINAETLPAVLSAGARNYAVVRAVCGSNDPYAAIRNLQDVEAQSMQR